MNTKRVLSFAKLQLTAPQKRRDFVKEEGKITLGKEGRETVEIS